MTWSWSSAGVPLRMPLSMNQRPSVASPPIIGTSKNVTSVVGPIVVRYQFAHASTGKRDLYVKPIATSASLPADRLRKHGFTTCQELPLEHGKRIADPQGFLRGAGSKCVGRHHDDSNETCGGEDAGHGV